MMNKRLGDVFSRYLAAEEIAGHIVLLRNSPGLRSRSNHVVGEKTATDSICVDRIDPDSYRGRVLEHTVEPKIR
jgi:hypothetical protein